MVSIKGSHHKLAKGRKTVSGPVHGKDVKKGLLGALLKETGLEVNRRKMRTSAGCMLCIRPIVRGSKSYAKFYSLCRSVITPVRKRLKIKLRTAQAGSLIAERFVFKGERVIFFQAGKNRVKNAPVYLRQRIAYKA